jgi:hypothetical protein
MLDIGGIYVNLSDPPDYSPGLDFCSDHEFYISEEHGIDGTFLPW